jgi:hypothetical protein
MSNMLIARMNNLPSYININPKSYDKASTVQITATQGTNSAKVGVEFEPVIDLFKVSPVLPELPDFQISQNAVSTFAIPRGNVAGNALKYSITTTGPKEYTPTIADEGKYTWKLSTPKPKSWTEFYTYGNNQLALVHEENTIFTMTYYFCPPLGVATTNYCFGIVSNQLPYAPTTDKPYILPKPVSLSGGRDYFITLEDDTKNLYKLNWVNVTYNKDTKKFSGKLFTIDMPDIRACNDYLTISNVQNGDGYLLCSLTPEQGNGSIIAWRLEADGKGGIGKITRAQYQDITYEDVNGKFCPY